MKKTILISAIMLLSTQAFAVMPGEASMPSNVTMPSKITVHHVTKYFKEMGEGFEKVPSLFPWHKKSKSKIRTLRTGRSEHRATTKGTRQRMKSRYGY